jgi:hypothetical protein
MTWLIAALAFAGGLALALLGRRGGRQDGSAHRVMEIPDVWPFDPRRIASSDERRVWAWLRQTFPDHHVLL